MDLDSKLRRVAEALLTQGEELRGVCVATQVGIFKGRQVLLGVTDGRLLVQGMNRKFEPVGDAVSLPPDRIADASAEGAGGGWLNVGLVIMSGAAVTLKVRTTDGEKLKLTMMSGTGVFGKLGGATRSATASRQSPTGSRSTPGSDRTKPLVRRAIKPSVPAPLIDNPAYSTVAYSSGVGRIVGTSRWFVGLANEIANGTHQHPICRPRKQSDQDPIDKATGGPDACLTHGDISRVASPRRWEELSRPAKLCSSFVACGGLAIA